jgi:hypothetical protein
MYLDCVKKKSSHGGKRPGAGRPRTYTVAKIRKKTTQNGWARLKMAI